jgi:hypothetical protein
MFGDPRLFYSSFDGANWDAQQISPGITSEGASLAVFHSALYSAWRGAVGDQTISWSKFNGAVWTPQRPLAGSGSSVGPCLAAFNDLLYMVWKGASGDEQIYYSTFNGTAWTAQQQVPGAGNSPDLTKKNAARGA